MTPEERAALDAFAIRYRMDSEDVDEALTLVGGDTAAPSAARAAIAAYALRRDMAMGRIYHAVIPAARAVIAAWRVPVEPTPEGGAAHIARLAKALEALESALAEYGDQR